MRFRSLLPRTAAAVAVVAVVSALVRAQSGPASPDEGSASRTWERLLKLRTTASLLHVTAHPDDEQGGMLSRVGRHEGARIGLLTLNRGEAGDNAIGPELFDGLGLIRTAELASAGRYYGLDEQYFTSVTDYGYSKRLDEALEHWDRDEVLRDMVRAIRRFRPLVVVSRWQGNERDGHGQHQAAGALAPDAVGLAGDASAFPELGREGLRPWRVRKLYVGGVRESEPWHVRLDTGGHDPVLGTSYSALGRLGLAMQRSQTSGRFDPYAPGQALYYRRIDAGAQSVREATFFDGIDVTLAGLYALAGVIAPAAHRERLQDVARALDAAVAAFAISNPAACVPPLARALAVTRLLAADTEDADARFVLESKARQLEDAIASAAGLSLAAVAEPQGLPEGAADNPFRPPPTLGPVTPGQPVAVRVMVTNGGSVDPSLSRLVVTHPGGTLVADIPAVTARLGPGERRVHVFPVAVTDDAPPTRPYFTRVSPDEARYRLLDASLAGRPASPPPFAASADVTFAGVPVTIRVPVVRREANLPWGYELHPLEILPPVSVGLRPRSRVVVRGTGNVATIEATVTSRAARPVEGVVELQLPGGWTASPARSRFALPVAGSGQSLSFTVHAPGIDGTPRAITAAASVAGRVYATDVEVIRHRDLPVQYLYRDARASVREVDVAVAPGLTVGYVMGVGDEVPGAIAQLGATVRLLDERDLSSGDLTRFDTIVTGTRAYAVRADLRAHNGRLLEYVKAGGNLVVLYNTPELTPETQAPYPASLPQDAEEVCEEQAPVEILAPDHPLLSRPNRITPADFDGWFEQRGSKFFATWDPRYTPLLSSHDRGQPPQRGGMLSARYGQGQYTYMAYALHRQVPEGVPGAYRLLANLISAGRGAGRR